MENSKKKAEKATEKPEKKSVDLELNENQLDAVAGGIIGGEYGGGCTGPILPLKKY